MYIFIETSFSHWFNRDRLRLAVPDPSFPTTAMKDTKTAWAWLVVDDSAKPIIYTVYLIEADSMKTEVRSKNVPNHGSGKATQLIMLQMFTSLLVYAKSVTEG